MRLLQWLGEKRIVGELPEFAVEREGPVRSPRLENQLAPFAIARVTLVRVYPKNPIGVVQETATDAKAAPASKPAKAEKPPRPQYGSKEDYQLNQAVNLLKGLQIISKR